MIGIDDDRRSSRRISLSRPCKVYDPRSRKYVGGTTANASREGLLVRLDRALAVAPGDRLYIVVAARRQALLRSRSMIEGRVVRLVADHAGEPAVAVRFVDAAPETLLPILRAA